MSNKTYDLLKWIAQYLLPASATLYFALSDIWGLPYGKEVVGTLTALTAFLGVILGISTAQYNKKDHSDGTLDIDTTSTDKDLYRLNLTTGFEDLKLKDEIKLKVNPKAYISQEEHRL